MGDTNVQSGNDASARAIQTYVNLLPKMLYTTAQGILPSELATVQAKEAVAPREQALNAALYSLYAPEFARTQAETYAKYAPYYSLANAATERDTMAGPGSQLVGLGQLLQQAVDPEFYKTRMETAGKISDLLGGMNPNRLSPVEMSNVERGLNRSNLMTGNYGTPAGMNTINAAMTYGNALDAKRQGVMNAINTATQFLPASRTGTDVFAQATGRSGTQALGSFGPGASTMLNAGNVSGSPGFGQNAFSMGNNLLNNVFQTYNTSNTLEAQKKTGFDQAMQALSAVGSFVGGAGKMMI